MKRFIVLAFMLWAASAFARGHFFRQYWAEFDSNISNHHDGRWRVNDPELALHPEFGKRGEARANGLVLLNAPEDLFALDYAELYLEMWGGHPHTANKRVTVNGKATYAIPDYGSAAGHCVYAYPAIKISPAHLVSGFNALQFSCDRGESFWGHFIMDNVALRCVLKPDSLLKAKPALASFNPVLVAPPLIINEKATLALQIPPQFQADITAVDFFARYTGFDENGDGENDDWHGYTFKRDFMFHVGRTTTTPFQVEWDTRLVPDQSAPVQFKALVTFADSLIFETEPTPGSVLSRDKESVQMFYCTEAPAPFWSRANNLNVAKLHLPFAPEKIVQAQLHVKIWDGGEGEVLEPFKINGHAYAITSKKAIHDVVYTIADVNPAHLRHGDNEITLLSDTEHHGIEVVRPGPCLVVRFKK